MVSPTDGETGDTLLVLMLSPLYRDRGVDHAVDADRAHELDESGVIDSVRRRGPCAVRLRNDDLTVRRNERDVSTLNLGAIGQAL